MTEDTSTAAATFPAESAICLVRVSGKDTLKVISGAFTFKSKSKTLDSIKPGTVSLGSLKDGKDTIDEAMLSYFKSPNSYTGEDMAEISLHGNPLILFKAVNILIKNGCRAAEPGEFTRRAFLNGKMDLSQAEAVADIVAAKNDTALKLSLSQLEGKEKKIISKLKESILKILALIEAEIDFAHEDIEKTSTEKVKEMLKGVLDKINVLIKNAEEGIKLKEGINLVISGKPNTGKSSLLNALLKKDKAIVTHVPGTTRDIIEDTLIIDGFPFKLSDTAGVRGTDNVVELEGIKRTEQALNNADLILFLIDGSVKLTSEDTDLFKKIKDKDYLVVINKNDLPIKVNTEEVNKSFNTAGALSISALKNRGIKDLTNEIKNTIISKNKFSAVDDVVITNMRHKTSLERAKANIEDALSKSSSHEELAIDIKQAVENISAIIGEISTEDILGDIFKNFCIGK